MMHGTYNVKIGDRLGGVTAQMEN
jgi:hypothetical protein